MVGKGAQVPKYNTGGGVLRTAKDDKPICPWLCNLVPVDVPDPGSAQTVLHPRKDVFVLKVAKIGPNGDRRCKMELELVTPKFPEKRQPYRVDTREAQCDPDPPPCSFCRSRSKRRQRN